MRCCIRSFDWCQESATFDDLKQPLRTVKVCSKRRTCKWSELTNGFQFSSVQFVLFLSLWTRLGAQNTNLLVFTSRQMLVKIWHTRSVSGRTVSHECLCMCSQIIAASLRWLATARPQWELRLVLFHADHARGRVIMQRSVCEEIDYRLYLRYLLHRQTCNELYTCQTVYRWWVITCVLMGMYTSARRI